MMRDGSRWVMNKDKPTGKKEEPKQAHRRLLSAVPDEALPARLVSAIKVWRSLHELLHHKNPSQFPRLYTRGLIGLLRGVLSKDSPLTIAYTLLVVSGMTQQLSIEMSFRMPGTRLRHGSCYAGSSRVCTAAQLVTQTYASASRRRAGLLDCCCCALWVLQPQTFMRHICEHSCMDLRAVDSHVGASDPVP